ARIGLNLFSQSDIDEDEQERRRHTAITAVCESAVSLSRQKIGALIVFERETKLGEIIKTGTVIDAEAVVELISNVFFPNSPLHDGAMIIRNGKLYAAGCFLPISDNHSISKTLGTRHRAALGMSENSDAVIIVVSEETGGISVAENGKLIRNYDAASLAERLEKMLFTPKFSDFAEKRPPFWRGKAK
ncbi:MAG: diadenylate cyclase, partial [Acetanaerobacterium sp.]